VLKSGLQQIASFSETRRSIEDVEAKKKNDGRKTNSSPEAIKKFFWGWQESRASLGAKHERSVLFKSQYDFLNWHYDQDYKAGRRGLGVENSTRRGVSQESRDRILSMGKWCSALSLSDRRTNTSFC